jgi:hypothetical protein
MNSTVFTLLALFGIKHFIADFLMQYDYMLRDKGVYGAEGGIHHAGVHACWTFLILIPFITSAEQLLILPLFDFIAHYHIDWVKQQLNRGYTYADRMFWVWLGADQALHYLTYVGIISYVTLS